MRKKISKIKRVFTLCLIFLFSINSFAAIVSDNDGSAFVTKAEFDALKTDFNEQIDNYNLSIDGKIDGSIASYLAGIKLTQVQSTTSLINLCNQKWVTSNKLDWPTTTTGSYKKYYINMGLFHCLISPAYTLTQVQFLTGASNKPAWKELNTTDPGVYYYGTKTTDGDYKLEQTVISKPVSAVSGIITSGGTADYSSNAFTIPTKDFTNGSSDAFTQSEDTWNLSIGGKTRSIAVVKTFSMVDSFSEVKNQYVTGKKLDTDNENFIEAVDVNKPGTVREYVQKDYCGYEIRNASGTQYKTWTQYTGTDNTRLAIYNHYYTSIAKTKIINPKATDALNKPVYYYQGLPIFKNDYKKGKVKFRLSFSITGGYDIYYKIQNAPFTDVDLCDPSSSPVASTTPKIGELCKTTDGQTLAFEIEECAEGAVYWIKALSSASGGTTGLDNPATIVSVGDIAITTDV